MTWGFRSGVWLNSTGQLQGGNNRDALYAIKECLMAAGATVVRSGNGVGYLADGTDLIDSGATFGINGAHIELKIGDAGPWYSIQHVSGGGFRVKRSSTAFTGGSPGTTRVEAGGEIIFGGGTDASPTGGNASWMDPASPGLVVGGADAAGNNAFWFAQSPSGPGGISQESAWAHDPVALAADADSDPAMSVIGYAPAAYRMFGHADGNNNSRLSNLDRAEPRTPHGYNVDGALWDSIGLMVPYMLRGLADVPDDGVQGEFAFVAAYARPQSVADPTTKGTSTLFAWVGPRNHFAGTHDWRGESDALIQVGHVVLPWNGTLVDANNGEIQIVGLDEFRDATPPTVTVVSPAEGGTLAPDGSVVVDVGDDDLAFVELSVTYPGGPTEVVFRGQDFRRPYTGSRADVGGGVVRYTIERTGGWPNGNPRFEIAAVDSAGNVA